MGSERAARPKARPHISEVVPTRLNEGKWGTLVKNRGNWAEGKNTARVTDVIEAGALECKSPGP